MSVKTLRRSDAEINDTIAVLKLMNLVYATQDSVPQSDHLTNIELWQIFFLLFCTGVMRKLVRFEVGGLSKSNMINHVYDVAALEMAEFVYFVLLLWLHGRADQRIDRGRNGSWKG